MTPEQAATIQPGDVVYERVTRQHYVVGRVFPHAIAAPLFHLEAIGRADTGGDPGRVNWHLCDLPHAGQPTRAPYRGGPRYSVRTLREKGLPVHPIPGDESRPDEARLDGTALRRRRLAMNLSQAALAGLLGVAANTVARWESGDRDIGTPIMLDLALGRLETDQRVRGLHPGTTPARA